MSIITQANRAIRVRIEGVETPDKILARSFAGSEQISRLFEFHLVLIHQKALGPLYFHDLLGRAISISIPAGEAETRHFHGIISQLVRTGEDCELRYFRAVVRPEFWRLTKMWHSRIFQDLSVPDILTSGGGSFPPILQGIRTHSSSLHGDAYATRNYTVQYRESDYNFASRLMEDDGVCYFFRHDENEHVMVLTDSLQAYPTLADSIRCSPETFEEAGMGHWGRVYGWERTQELTSGLSHLRDYAFQHPNRIWDAGLPILDSVDLDNHTHVGPNGYHRVQLAVAGNNQNLEISDYPAGYAKFFDEINSQGEPRVSPAALSRDSEAEADRVLRRRTEREESRGVRFSGIFTGECCDGTVPPDGDTQAELGWREHTDWQAYFGGRVRVRFDPLFHVSFERPMLPSFIGRLLGRLRRWGRVFARLIESIERRLQGTIVVEFHATLVGSAERNAPGPATCTGAGFQGRFNVRLRLCVRDIEVGSDSWLDPVPHVAITVMSSGSVSLRAEGPLSWDDERGVGTEIHLRATDRVIPLSIQVRGLGPISQFMGTARYSVRRKPQPANKRTMSCWVQSTPATAGR